MGSFETELPIFELTSAYDAARADDALADFARLQLSLLRDAAARCGDRLVYATCSTLREENEDVVAAFEDSAFELEDTRRLLPGPWPDGFFVARWRRRSV